MKKIKVIDLINLIAEGKQPKRIKYQDIEYEYINDGDFLKGYGCKGNVGILWLDEEIAFDNPNCLNDEVEILDEEDEIDIQNIKKLNPNKIYFKDGTELVYREMYCRINELIEAVKQLDNKLKEE